MQLPKGESVTVVWDVRLSMPRDAVLARMNVWPELPLNNRFYCDSKHITSVLFVD
jgi:hypothetical protein